MYHTLRDTTSSASVATRNQNRQLTQGWSLDADQDTDA